LTTPIIQKTPSFKRA